MALTTVLRTNVLHCDWKLFKSFRLLSVLMILLNDFNHRVTPV